MSLPIDVVDYTLSFLHSDRVTLKICAQSHPTLSRLSERFIYANVTLHDDLDKFDPLEEDLRTSEFTQVIAKIPSIARHVRSLAVCVTDNADPEQGQATSSHLEGVASLLPTFSGLTKLTIKGNIRNKFPFSWRTLPETFHQAFLHFLHRQAMKDVVIFYAAFFPISLLNNCKYVRATLDKCEETQYDVGEESTTEDMLSLSACHPAGTFEHLSIRHCSQTCGENIAAWVETHHLRSLKYNGLRGASELRKFLPEVLLACSNSLTELHLDIEDYFRSWYSFSDNAVIYDEGLITHFPFTLVDLCNLERLTIDARLQSYATDAVIGRAETHHSPIPAIAELISTASSSPFLKHIFLNFTYTFWGFGILDPGVVWIPLIPLAAKCSSLSMTVSISPRFKVRESQEEPPTSFSSLAEYGGLIPYVEKGAVVVTIPEE